jgi:hypoxanthine phosphoribosyltransferase
MCREDFRGGFDKKVVYFHEESRMNPHPDVVLKPFIDEAGIQRRVGELVGEIAADFRGGGMVVVSVLKGSFMFTADLVRRLHGQNIPLVIDFLQVSSYGSRTVSSGRISMVRDLTTDIENQRVLLVDDILDTGRTSEFLRSHLLRKKPGILKSAVLLDKPGRRAVPFQADYVGFRVPDAYVVGYGLDYDSRYRELPYLSLVSFNDRNAEPVFEFRIVNDTIALEGSFDAEGVGHIRETLLHWKGDLNLDLEKLDGIGHEGLGLIGTVSGKLTGSGRKMRLLGMTPVMRQAFIHGGLQALLARGPVVGKPEGGGT